MQSFHAVIYAVIVQAGITAFINSENWFFLVICTTFLFEGEKILRKIFNLGSGFGTMKDLGESGLVAYGVFKSVAGKFKGKSRDDSDDDSDEDDDSEGGNEADDAGEVAARPIAQTIGARQNINSANSMNPQLSGLAGAQNVVNNTAQGVRGSRTRRAIGVASGVAGGAFGAMLGTTYSLAAGQDLSNTAVKGVAGWMSGRTVSKTLIGKPIVGVTNVFAGRKYKKAVLRGDFDNDFKDAGLDLKAEEAADAATADLIRKALGEQMSAAIRRGEEVGNYKFYKTINKR